MKSKLNSKRTARRIRKIAFSMLFKADRIESLGISGIISNYLRKIIKKVRYASIKKSIIIDKAELPILNKIVLEEPKLIRDGVIFIGYAEGSLGLGQSFRSNLEAARSAELSFAIFPVRKNIETRIIGPFMEERYDKTNAYSINIFEIAVDQIEIVKQEIDRVSIEKSYNIIRPYWELPRAPEEWRPLLRDFHELWAPNQYIADAFSYIFDKTIIIMPPAMDSIEPYFVEKESVDLDKDIFYFLFSFDYNSSPYRKNPLGVIEAFSKAFVNNEKVGLIIKSNGNSQNFPHIKFAIENAAEKDRRIRIIDVHVDRQKMRDLLSAADVYVSLHRAEGLGLGMVEAMALGRSVIGTNFSGSTDFLNSETGYPIPYRLRPVQDFEYPWSTGQLWAEPDLASAASAMIETYQSRKSLDARHNLARNAVLKKYGQINAGKEMKSRIEYIQNSIKPNK